MVKQDSHIYSYRSCRLHIFDFNLTSFFFRSSFGRYIYFTNLFVYILFVMSIVAFTINIERYYKIKSGNTITFKGLVPPSDNKQPISNKSVNDTINFQQVSS